MIIIDMEMPKTCNDCPCSYFTEGMSSNYCQVNHRDFDKETEGKTYFGTRNGVYTRQKWCPLKESEDKKWIPVNEQLPAFNDLVLASTKSDYPELKVIITAYKAEEYWFNGAIEAWMTLPKPYIKKEE